MCGSRMSLETPLKKQQFPADLFTFTKEILNGKSLMCSVESQVQVYLSNKIIFIKLTDHKIEKLFRDNLMRIVFIPLIHQNLNPGSDLHGISFFLVISLVLLLNEPLAELNYCYLARSKLI